MAVPKSPRSITQSCGDPGFMSCHVSRYIWNIFPLALLIIGTCGNILTIAVLTRKRMRKSSTTVYLLVLAISDLAFLWTSLFRQTLQFVFKINIRDSSMFVCKTITWSAFTSGGFSIWLLVILTLERVLFTKLPVFAKSKMTRRFAMICSVAMFCLHGLINTHYLFGRTLERIEVKASTAKSLSVYKCRSVNDSYARFSTEMWPTIVFTINNLIPLVLILSGNVLICHSLRQQKKILPTLQATGIGTNKDKTTRTTRLLFVLSGFFMATITPFCVYFIVERMLEESLDDKQFADLQLASAIFKVFIWSNSTFNFVLYFISGSLFKNEWKTMISEVKAKICFSLGTRDELREEIVTATRVTTSVTMETHIK